MNVAAVAVTPDSPFHIADLNQDGVVGGIDLAIMIGHWGETPNTCPPYGIGDIDESCEVEGNDLAIVLGAWGETGIPDDPVPPPVLPPGTWSRPFPQPTQPLPCYVQVAGTDITVSSQLYGEMFDHPLDAPYYGDGDLMVFTITKEQPRGFDITYFISNPTGTSRQLPTLWLPGFQMENTIQGLALPFGTTFQTVRWTGADAVATEQNPYPKTRYAPVAVGYDSRFAVGLSLCYPVLDYKHPISIELRRYSAMDEWAAYCLLDGAIAPGESRYYRMLVRFSHPQDWIHTLEPYRDYFWSLHGNVPAYVQDLYPTWGRAEAFSEFQEPGNPRGFTSVWSLGEQYRIDLDGWEHEVDHVLQVLEEKGFQKLMMWVPTGFYSFTTDYPSLIMTQWLPPMLATQNQLQRFGDAGIDFGFWWGDSSKVAYQWDPPFIETLDIDNPAHVAVMLNEAVLCEQRGATTIGLDSYRKLPLWDSVPWLDTLRTVNPGVKYIAEPNCNDVLHMHLPFLTDYTNILTAPQLADYLVPGREVITVLAEPTLDTVENCWRYISWGSAVVLYWGDVTYADLLPAIEAAQDGWVGDPYAPVPTP